MKNRRWRPPSSQTCHTLFRRCASRLLVRLLWLPHPPKAAALSNHNQQLPHLQLPLLWLPSALATENLSWWRHTIFVGTVARSALGDDTCTCTCQQRGLYSTPPTELHSASGTPLLNDTVSL